MGASWEFEPGINFYRAMWQLAWMEPVFRESPMRTTITIYCCAMIFRSSNAVSLKLLLKDDLSKSALAKAGS